MYIRKHVCTYIHIYIYTYVHAYIHSYIHVHTYIIYMFRAIWEFAQSADCVAQTEDPQIACQSADWQAICRLHNTNC